ncbi:MAG TPA: efflux RND transporter periplasmic adaptor subunit [Terriglobales bacterium]|nr:efflux RND transporter periplasmic adaptor subunit [Terriglobales bacterium]
MNLKKILLFVLLTALLLAGCAKTEEPPAEEAGGTATAVETAVAVKGDLAARRELSGKVEADADVAVMAPLPVKVITVYAKVGDKVAKGDLLFTLDKTDVEKQYRPLKDNYDRTKAVADETLRQLRQNLEDTKALYEAGFASQKEVEGLELALLSQEAQFASSLDALGTNMDAIEDTLTDASVKAPTAGVVSSVSVVESGVASPAAPAFVISRTDRVSASFEVSESLLTGLSVGQPVTVTASSVDGVYEAEISSISPTASPITKLYTVKVEIDNKDGALRSGMFVTAALETGRREGAVTVPSGAILSEAGGDVVFVVENGVARRVPVETGLVSGDVTEILSGLTGGEQVVTKGQSYIEDGDQVRVVGK